MENSILEALRKPFPPEVVQWKRDAISKDEKVALAIPIACVTAYQKRLDEVCGMDWSVTYTPWGDHIVCHLTIHGVTRSSSDKAPGASEVQAFKRACAMFGLGRYLMSLPEVWVAYDAATDRFTDSAKAQLDGFIVQNSR